MDVVITFRPPIERNFQLHSQEKEEKRQFLMKSLMSIIYKDIITVLSLFHESFIQYKRAYVSILRVLTNLDDKCSGPHLIMQLTLTKRKKISYIALTLHQSYETSIPCSKKERRYFYKDFLSNWTQILCLYLFKIHVFQIDYDKALTYSISS